MREGKEREYENISSNSTGELQYGNIYTVPESAEALGKTVLTLKTWIRERMIPPPVCKDTSRGFMHYTRRELQLIANNLKVHFKTYDYLHKTHVSTINAIWQALEIHRKTED